MPLQVRVQLAQVEQIRLLHKSCLCPGTIQDGCSMTLEMRGGGEHFGDDGVTKPQTLKLKNVSVGYIELSANL